MRQGKRSEGKARENRPTGPGKEAEEGDLTTPPQCSSFAVPSFRESLGGRPARARRRGQRPDNDSVPHNIVIADDIRTAVDPDSAQAADCANIVGIFSGDSIPVADNTLFGAEHYDQGPSDAEDCNGTNNGRGCLNLNGGIIQKQRGAVGLTDGHGYTKRYQYKTCAVNDPPPYH